MNNRSRRLFVQRSIGLVTASTALARVGIAVAQTVAPPAPVRTYTAGRFGLELDGVPQTVGILRMSWSPATAPTTQTAIPGAPPAIAMQPPSTALLRLDLACNEMPSEGLKPWIENAIAHQNDRRTVSFVNADFNYDIQDREDFTAARVSSVTYAGFDGVKPDLEFLSVVAEAATYRWSHGSGRLPIRPDQKLGLGWQQNQFRLLGTPPIAELAFTRTIAPFTLAQNVAGGSFDFTIDPARVGLFVEAWRAGGRWPNTEQLLTLNLVGYRPDSQPNGYVVTFGDCRVESVFGSAALPTVRIHFADARVVLP